jgi:hypothetical protein
MTGSGATDRIETVVRERPVPAFVCVTVLITRGIRLPVAFGLVGAGPINKIDGFAPTIVGFVLTAVLTGEQGHRDLGTRLVDWRAGLGWYLLVYAFSLSPRARALSRTVAVSISSCRFIVC